MLNDLGRKRGTSQARLIPQRDKSGLSGGVSDKSVLPRSSDLRRDSLNLLIDRCERVERPFDPNLLLPLE